MFFHRGTEDFDKKLHEYDIIIPKAMHYTVFKDEDIVLSFNQKVNITLDGEILHVGGSLTGGNIKVRNIITDNVHLRLMNLQSGYTGVQ